MDGYLLGAKQGPGWTCNEFPANSCRHGLQERMNARDRRGASYSGIAQDRLIASECEAPLTTYTTCISIRARLCTSLTMSHLLSWDMTKYVAVLLELPPDKNDFPTLVPNLSVALWPGLDGPVMNLSIGNIKGAMARGTAQS